MDRQLLTILTWNKDSWNKYIEDNKSVPDIYKNSWSTLTDMQKFAAIQLGYSCMTWPGQENMESCTLNLDILKNTDVLIDKLFEDEFFSPLHQEENELINTVLNEVDKYFESDEYYQTFLKNLCQQKNGKWILGSFFYWRF